MGIEDSELRKVMERKSSSPAWCWAEGSVLVVPISRWLHFKNHPLHWLLPAELGPDFDVPVSPQPLSLAEDQHRSHTAGGCSCLSNFFWMQSYGGGKKNRKIIHSPALEISVLDFGTISVISPCHSAALKNRPLHGR